MKGFSLPPIRDVDPGFARFLVWVALGALTLGLGTAQADVLDGLLQTMESASSGWMAQALSYATTLFFGLAAIEFAWSAIQLTLKKSELNEIFVGLTFKVLSISFFGLVLLGMLPTWLPAIMDSFTQAAIGITGGGMTAITPSQVLQQGIELAGDVVGNAMGVNVDANTGFWTILRQGLGEFMLTSIVIGLTGLILIIAYAILAAQLFIATVETFIVLGGAALMLGFSGSRWTMQFAEKFFAYAFAVGVKMFALTLIIGFGDQLASAMAADLAQASATPDGPTMGDFLSMTGVSVAFGAMSFLVPAMASSMLSGAPALSLSNAGGAAAGIAGGIGSVAALGTAGALSGVAALLKKSTDAAAGGIGGAALGQSLGSIGGTAVSSGRSSVGGAMSGVPGSVGGAGSMGGTQGANNPFAGAASASPGRAGSGLSGGVSSGGPGAGGMDRSTGDRSMPASGGAPMGGGGGGNPGGGLGGSTVADSAGSASAMAGNPTLPTGGAPSQAADAARAAGAGMPGAERTVANAGSMLQPGASGAQGGASGQAGQAAANGPTAQQAAADTLSRPVAAVPGGDGFTGSSGGAGANPAGAGEATRARLDPQAMQARFDRDYRTPDQKKQPGQGLLAAAKFLARQAKRPHLGHDGQSSATVGIRMNLDD